MGRKISKIECGSCLPGSNELAKGKGLIFGNTCFFNSLLAGLRRKQHPAANYGYEVLLTLGEWPEDKKGKMVDTIDDEHNLIILANSLGVTIDIHTEVEDGEVASVYEPFAPQSIRTAPTINIVKLKGRRHFNFCEFEDPEPTGTAKCDSVELGMAAVLQPLAPKPAVAKPGMGARQPLLEKPGSSDIGLCKTCCRLAF